MREEGGRGKGHHFTVGSLSLCLVLVSWWLCVRAHTCVFSPSFACPHRTPLRSELPREGLVGPLAAGAGLHKSSQQALEGQVGATL